jgi:dGTPase
MTVAKALGLDQELAMAIGIGHDFGHPPFGHAGEEAIQSLRLGHLSAFHHETHGARVVEHLEQKGQGLNLTYAVRDGIAHHCGESNSLLIEPRIGVLTEEALYDTSLMPATPEGCIVRIADRISFIGRDLVDAVYADIINADDVPKGPLNKIGCLGKCPKDDPIAFNSAIINYFTRDMMKTSRNDGSWSIGFSEGAQKVMDSLYKYSYKELYKDDMVGREKVKVQEVLKTIHRGLKGFYDEFTKDEFDLAPLREYVKGGVPRDHVPGRLGIFLQDHAVLYLGIEDEDHRRNQALVDYIARLTDTEAMRDYLDLVLPKQLI